MVSMTLGMSGDAEVQKPVQPPTGRPVMDMAPPRVPTLYPTLTIIGKSPSFGVAKALARALSPHTARTADLVLMDKDARSNLARALSDLPPWLDAVAQISGRVPIGRARVRVTKNYPLGDGEGAEE